MDSPLLFSVIMSAVTVLIIALAFCSIYLFENKAKGNASKNSASKRRPPLPEKNKAEKKEKGKPIIRESGPFDF